MRSEDIHTGEPHVPGREREQGNWSPSRGCHQLWQPDRYRRGLLPQPYVERNPFPGATPDRDGLKKSLTEFRVAFPDFRYTVEDEIAVEDKLVHRLSARGTQKGEFQGVPATGKTATWSELHIARITNGKVVEHWGITDQLGMMQQLGLAPEPRLASVPR